MTVNLIIEHMFLVLAAITMAIIIGIPLGICAYMVPKSKTIILRIEIYFKLFLHWRCWV